MKGYALNLATTFIAGRTVYARRVFDLLHSHSAAQHPADWRPDTPMWPAAYVDVRAAAASQPRCGDTDDQVLAKEILVHVSHLHIKADRLAHILGFLARISDDRYGRYGGRLGRAFGHAFRPRGARLRC